MAPGEGLTVVLVDTTVWIDFFAGYDTAEVAVLVDLLARGEDICACGVIWTEVLQGIRRDSDYRRTRSHFESLLFLNMGQSTFVRAADVCLKERRKLVMVGHHGAEAGRLYDRRRGSRA